MNSLAMSNHPHPSTICFSVFACRKYTCCEYFAYLNVFKMFLGYFAEVMPTVKLIPKPKEPLLLPRTGSDGCLRCAVVGTSGILYGSKLGKEIDAHDYVFR